MNCFQQNVCQTIRQQTRNKTIARTNGFYTMALSSGIIISYCFLKCNHLFNFYIVIWKRSLNNNGIEADYESKRNMIKTFYKDYRRYGNVTGRRNP